MTNPNWGMLQGMQNPGETFINAMRFGQDQRIQRERGNALNALLQNPNDPAIAQNLGRFDPEMALQIQGQQQQRAMQAQQADVTRRAVMGDSAAQGELAAFNPDLFRELSADQRKQAEQGVKTLGELAMMADTPQEWDEIVDNLSQVNPEFSKYRGQFTMRQAYIAQANQAAEFLKQQEPQFLTPPPGGNVFARNRSTGNISMVIDGGTGAALAGGSPPDVAEDVIAPILSKAQQSKVITPEDAARVRQSLGPNGQAQFDGWLRLNGIQIVKVIGGKRYVQRDGEWYEAN